MKRERVITAVAWVVIALPALYQLALLATAIAGRIAYPYDLEWMEGGMLQHALRSEQSATYLPPGLQSCPARPGGAGPPRRV